MKKESNAKSPAAIEQPGGLKPSSGAEKEWLAVKKIRRERLFETSDIRLVIVGFLEQRPAHGYELIKAVEDLSKGEYTPSASIIYPNLSWLEEQGYAIISHEIGGKKQFSLTAEGLEWLNTHRDRLKIVIERLQSLAILSNNRNIPQMHRAVNNIRMALNLRLAKGEISQETLYTITDALDQAAKIIERS